MSISDLQRPQPSLRGLLAQQRGLDVTSHNIANVEHRRLHPPGGRLRRHAPLLIDSAGGTANGAQLGQGVDVQSYRRVRDDFLDLQYRAQNMSPAQADGPRAPDQVQSRLREPARPAPGTRSTSSGARGTTLAANPRAPARQAGVVDAAQTLAAALQVAGQATSRPRRAGRPTRSATRSAPAARSSRSPTSSRRSTASTRRSPARSPTTSRPPRPAARPALADTARSRSPRTRRSTPTGTRPTRA